MELQGKKKSKKEETKGIIGEKRYPPRLYPDGKSPIHKRSMHHNCTLASFGFMKECIGEEVYNDIRDNTQVGVILKLADSDYVWWAGLVHHILTRQLAVKSKYEMWALIEGSPIRFSLYEYEHISGLNCKPIDVDDQVDVDHIEFWEELQVDVGVGPNWYDLDVALKSCRTWDVGKRKMIGLLFVIHVGILGISRSSRIPLQYAKRVLDMDVFQRFPWGRICYKELIQSIKVVSFAQDGYAIHGCVHVLMIWALDSLKNIGNKYGNKRKNEDDGQSEEEVPLLCWGGGRPRIGLAETLASEKKLKKKVAVKHCVMKPLEEIYPFWPGENAVYGEGVGGKKQVDNLLHDIFNGCLDEKHWDECLEIGPDRHKLEKRKEKVDCSEDIEEESPQKMRKTFKQTVRRSRGPVKLKDVSDESEGEGELVVKEKASLEGIMKLVATISEKLDTVNSNLGGRLDSIDERVTDMQTKITALENDVVDLKTKNDSNVQERVDGSEGRGGEDGDSRTGEASAEQLEVKDTSQDEFPISCMVRNKGHNSNSNLSLKNIRHEQGIKELKALNKMTELDKVKELKKVKEMNKVKELNKLQESKKLQQLEEFHYLQELQKMQELKKLQELKTLQAIKKLQELEDVEKLKELQVVQGSEYRRCIKSEPRQRKRSLLHSGQGKLSGLVRNMTAEFDAIHASKLTECKFMDLSHEILMGEIKTSDPPEFQARKSLGHGVEKLVMLCKKKDEGPKMTLNVRKKTLASTQIDPYIGSSVVKRILRGKVLSPNHYDPFEKVSEDKVQLLMEFIDQNLEDIFDDRSSYANFYLRIITPKEMWPVVDLKFGWLKDAHMCALMHMLRKRSLLPQSPYFTDRISFLDPWFVNQWAHDYKKFESQKNWLFPDSYLNVYNGKSPIHAMTNKRWVHDVDILYFPHNVDNIHWVAIEVNLLKRRVKVYDSIISVKTDDEVFESCKPYTRMIPALMQAVAPPAEKKLIGAAAFSIYRVKTTPQNVQEGDCGVYSVKFIECLAIGLTFEGLSDAAMPGIRLKMGAEVYNEVPDTDCFIQMSDPNPRGSDSGGVEFISQAYPP